MVLFDLFYFAFVVRTFMKQVSDGFHETHRARHPRFDRAFRAVFLAAETPDAVRKIEGGAEIDELQGFRRAHLHADTAPDAFFRVDLRVDDQRFVQGLLNPSRDADAEMQLRHVHDGAFRECQ